jgi:thymidylate synthase ThyX
MRGDGLPEVKLKAVLQSSEDKRIGPEETSFYGALNCFEERTGFQIAAEHIKDLDSGKMSVEEWEKKKEGLFRETSGRGHGSVLDQNAFLFEIENLPRSATLMLCLPQYLAHLQQSLRRADASRGFWMDESMKDTGAKELMTETFSLYDKAKVDGISTEDARIILPLNTRTNIQTLGDARELMHLHSMSHRPGVPPIVTYVVDKMIEQATAVAPRLMKDRGTNYESLAWYPSSQLFSLFNSTLGKLISENLDKRVVLLSSSGDEYISEAGLEKAVRKRDEAELANLKHYHMEFLAPMSLMSFHQATRQRTWDQSIEPIYQAAGRGKFVMPPSIKGTNYESAYEEIMKKQLDMYHDLMSKGIIPEEAVGVLPHSLEVYDAIHVNGWNALHAIGKRACTAAQWEIRGIAKQMASALKEVNPILGKYVGPQCEVYNRCPEKKPCKAEYQQKK